MTKYLDDDMNEDCDPSGTFFTKVMSMSYDEVLSTHRTNYSFSRIFPQFTDGSRFKMSASQVNKARELFEKEAHALAICGMPREDACNALDETTSGSVTVTRKLCEPILSVDEDEDPENYERIFEESFDGKIPGAIVGVMFDDKNVGVMDATKNYVSVPLWEGVLM